jgi:hypothetical protein
LELRGAAPVRDRGTCAIVDWTMNSPNSTLVFYGEQAIGD